MADEQTIWVISNRRDDRVVLFERDDRHPGGEAFIGGAGPARVARTAAVEAALRAGTAVEIPEPPDGPKKPIDFPAVEAGARAASPGEAIPLGRALDPAVVPEGALAEVKAQQKEAGEEVPVPAGVIVPPDEPSRRETRRR